MSDRRRRRTQAAGRTESGFIPASVGGDKICLQQAVFGEGKALPFPHDEVVQQPHVDQL